MKNVFVCGGWIVKQRAESCFLVYKAGSSILYACKGSLSEAVAYCYG